jgi:hypothetical protein
MMNDVLLASVASNATIFSPIAAVVILLAQIALGLHIDSVPVLVWP